MQFHPDSLGKLLMMAFIGITAGLLTTFTGLTITNANRISSLEADANWIKAALTRIELSVNARQNAKP